MRLGGRKFAGIGGLLACLLLWAPGALAAAPVNDHFDGRVVLGGALPIAVAGNNEGATKEVGEPNHNGFSAAGHSVWYEWEATATGLVTIGVCDSSFRAVVGIYTGTTVGGLVRVVSGNSSEGPHCLYSSSEYTFEATAGSIYEIAVDGDAFAFPEGPAPVSTGTIALRIEATPAPANDDFAAAAALTGTTTEEPGGARFYFASQRGHNWGATREEGEPAVADGGGASVWYAWTAPESGSARVNVCCGSPGLIGIHLGDTLGSLLQIYGGPGSVEMQVVAGTTYRIAVDGRLDGGTGRAATGSFSLRVAMVLPPGPAGAAPTVALVADTTPPQTTILYLKKPKDPSTKYFAFKASEQPATFRCRLDDRPFRACGSSKTYRNLKPGRHVFRVAAVDAAGNRDPSPATVRFRIPYSKPSRGRA
jgi:hypothetical protein